MKEEIKKTLQRLNGKTPQERKRILLDHQNLHVSNPNFIWLKPTLAEELDREKMPEQISETCYRVLERLAIQEEK